MQKIRYCKCGHTKDSHYKLPRTKLSIITECQECKCSEYMNRDGKSKKISMIYGFVLLSLICIFVSTINIPLLSITNEMKIPVNMMGLILLLVLGCTMLEIFSGSISPYLDFIRRKDYATVR